IAAIASVCSSSSSSSSELPSFPICDVQHVVYAISVLEPLRVSTAAALKTVGYSPKERQLERIVTYVTSHLGCKRSNIMNHFNLSGWDMDNVKATLVQRDRIR